MNADSIVPVALGIGVRRPAVFVQILQEYVAGLLLALIGAPVIAIGLVHGRLLVALLDVAGVVVCPHVVVVMVVTERAGDGRNGGQGS